MKKMFILLLALNCFFLSGQVKQSPEIKQVGQEKITVSYLNVTLKQTVNGWRKVNGACAGCASFYYKIMRTENKWVDGYYYYYIYFYNNSFYFNGEPASTYINDVNVYQEKNVIKNIEYVLISFKETNYELVKSTSAEPLTLTFKKISLY